MNADKLKSITPQLHYYWSMGHFWIDLVGCFTESKKGNK